MPVACEIVLALQSMITRTVDAFDPAVLTIAQIRGGTMNNVIPESVKLDRNPPLLQRAHPASP